MHASFPAVCIACLLLVADLSCQMVAETTSSEVEVQDSEQTTTESSMPMASSSTTGESNNCTTARAVAGACVQRASCEYSTLAIDFTLYEPHGYVRPCQPGFTCCPLQYISEAKDPAPSQEVNFDED